MREALVILVVLFVLLALTAVRYRKQIGTMIKIWRSLQAMRSQVKGENAPHEPSIPAGPLVNCAKCGTWVPEQRAIKLRGGTNYCSSACLESAVTTH